MEGDREGRRERRVRGTCPLLLVFKTSCDFQTQLACMPSPIPYMQLYCIPIHTKCTESTEPTGKCTDMHVSLRPAP